MPNIEVHGLGWFRARIVRRRIFELFKDKSYAGEMVVTVFRTRVSDANGISQPFLRLATSHLQYAYEIVSMLKRLGIDIEFLQLEQFIPKKSR